MGLGFRVFYGLSRGFPERLRGAQGWGFYAVQKASSKFH